MKYLIFIFNNCLSPSNVRKYYVKERHFLRKLSISISFVSIIRVTFEKLNKLIKIDFRRYGNLLKSLKKRYSNFKNKPLILRICAT